MHLRVLFSYSPSMPHCQSIFSWFIRYLPINPTMCPSNTNKIFPTWSTGIITILLFFPSTHILVMILLFLGTPSSSTSCFVYPINPKSKHLIAREEFLPIVIQCCSSPVTWNPATTASPAFFVLDGVLQRNRITQQRIVRWIRISQHKRRSQRRILLIARANRNPRTSMDYKRT